MNNLDWYEAGRKVPDNAKRKIPGGRLKGMTDIKPMWRIKKLTEMFGPCGIGWKAPIKRTWGEEGANGEIIVNMEIALIVRDPESGEWSDEIPGIGGNKLVAREKDGLFTNDECYKSAYTDALSVACKMLGIAADVYWDGDKSKYGKDPAPDGKGDDLPQTLDEWKRVKVTKESLKAFGVKDADKMLTDITKKLKKPAERFTKEDTAYVWGVLWAQKFGGEDDDGRGEN